jgi:tetratricopeptide (TPR) repeat protein
LKDFASEMKNMQPINIKNIEGSSYKINDNIRKSIILYNKSVAEIKFNNVDIAISDLKKALSYNKGFSEAEKLLGFCYANEKRYRKAISIFKRLAEDGAYGDLAEEYIKKAITEKNISKTMNTIEKVNIKSKGTRQSDLPKYISGKRIYIFAILVIGVTAASTYWYIHNKDLSFKKTDTVKEAAVSAEITEKTTEEKEIIPNLNNISNEKYKNIEVKLNQTELELEYYKNKYNNLSALNEVEKNLKDGYYEKAAKILIGVKNTDNDGETKTKFDNLMTELKAKGFWSIYNQGSKLFKDKKYNEALPKLIIASEIDPNAELMPWIIYQIGVCYKETNDSAKALESFHKVKDNYPKSQYASYADRMLKQME